MRITFFISISLVLITGSAATAQTEATLADTNAGRPPTIFYTDLNPVRPYHQEETKNIKILQVLLDKLPKRLSISIRDEESLRFESNINQTAEQPVRAAIFRTMPDVSIGYMFPKFVELYSDYQLYKDIFIQNFARTRPTPQNLSMGVRKTFLIGQYTNVVASCPVRENWNNFHQRSSDIIPSIILTHNFHDLDFDTPRIIKDIYAGTTLQMHSLYYFQGPTREFDPGYTMGVDWTFKKIGKVPLGKGISLKLADTFVTNYRHRPFNDNPAHGSVSMIPIAELSYELKPGLIAFARAEDQWSWKSAREPGISGYDFRIFGGIRMTLDKRSENAPVKVKNKP